MSGTKFGFTQERLERFLWGLTLVLLPLTSFRYLPFFGDSQVKPLSFLPIIFLVLSILLRSIRQKKFYFGQGSLSILLVLIFVLILSSSVGAFLAPPGYLNFTYLPRLLRAWITLFVGLTFFFVPAVMVRDEDDLRFMLKWLFIGMLGHFAWSLVQWVALHTSQVSVGETTLRKLVNELQFGFSMTGITSTGRVSGLALEPSWLAAQMAVLYLPWLFSTLITRYSFTRNRVIFVLLFGIGVMLSALSYSRSGIVIVMVSTILTLILTGRETIGSMFRWFIVPFKYAKPRPPTRNILFRLLVLSLGLVILVAGLFLLGQNPYFASLWQVRGDDLVGYLVNISAGPRLAFAWAGWNIFISHPIFGVGLGAAGFYMQSALPDWAHFNLSEISIILSPAYTGFANIKNLYLRLLAEGGILAFCAWISFYLFIFSRILILLKSKIKYLQYVAVAGMFTFFALVMTNFTLDSFAMPLLWLPFGVIMGIFEGEKIMSSM